MFNKNFENLSPHDILNFVESHGYQATGRCLQLNSYENRVFEIELENHEPLITKIYRPGRWSQDVILEEHSFLQELQGESFCVVAPISHNGKTLWEQNGLYWSLFPKFRGRMIDEMTLDHLKSMGRVLARLHNLGAKKDVIYRHRFDVHPFGQNAWKDLKSWIEPSLVSSYETCVSKLFERLEEGFSKTPFLRIHGDCHRGNILLKDGEYALIDFDDFCLGPAAQDLWMLFPSLESEAYEEEVDTLLDSYEELRHISDDDIELFEPLRAFRIMLTSAWIARRWQDPSFKKLFPDFGTTRYWQDEIQRIQQIF